MEPEPVHCALAPEAGLRLGTPRGVRQGSEEAEEASRLEGRAGAWKMHRFR